MRELMRLVAQCRDVAFNATASGVDHGSWSHFRHLPIKQLRVELIGSCLVPAADFKMYDGIAHRFPMLPRPTAPCERGGGAALDA